VIISANFTKNTSNNLTSTSFELRLLTRRNAWNYLWISWSIGAPISILHSQKYTHCSAFYSPFSESACYFVLKLTFFKSHSLFSKVAFACMFPFAILKIYWQFRFVFLSHSPFWKCCINFVVLFYSILHSHIMQYFLNPILHSQKRKLKCLSILHSPFSILSAKGIILSMKFWESRMVNGIFLFSILYSDVSLHFCKKTPLEKLRTKMFVHSPFSILNS